MRKNKEVVMYDKSERWKRSLKRGDEFILRSSRHGISALNNGKVFVVISECTANITFSVGFSGKCKYGSTGSMSFYLDDDFVPCTRKDRIKKLKEDISDIKEELTTKEADLDILENYATEEDYVAAKIDKILKAHKSGGGAKEIGEVLKLMKSSNLL